MSQSKVEILSNTVDTFGVILSFVWIAKFKESLSLYILIATAISLTITVGIKIYNSNHLVDITSSAVNTGDQDANNNPFDDADGGSTGAGYLDSGLNTLEFVAGHKSAIGTVKLMDLAVESEYSMSKQSTLMLAKYAMGHGILRPEGAVSVIT